jgi:membrane-associated phospholipid phosphatase
MRRRLSARAALARPVLLAAFSLGALLVLYALALGTRTGRRLDQWAESGLADAGGYRLHMLNTAALDSVGIALAAATTCGLAVFVLGRRRHGALALCLLVVANGTTFVTKGTLYALDPLGGEAARSGGAPSFPSGHTTAALSAALAAVLLAPRPFRRAVALAGAGYAAAVGLASVAEGGHFPSDVGGSYLVTAIAATTTLIGLQARPSPAAPRRIPLVLTGATAVLLASGFGYWAALALDHESVLVALHASTSSVVAFALVLMASVAVVFGYASCCDSEESVAHPYGQQIWP